MIFPIGDEQVIGGHKPIVSYSLIAANILMFLFELSLNPQQLQDFFTTYGSIPQEITSGQDMFTLFTSMFLHGGWMHLIGNMVFLWVFADNIEATIGQINFLAFYVAGGLFASVAHVLFNVHSVVPSIGASGAISAVLGAYLVMFPSSQVKVLILFFFRSFKMPALFFLGIWIVQQLISGVGAIASNSAQASGGVAWWAHIGGFVFGVVAGFFMRSSYIDKTNYIKGDYV